MSEQYDDGFSDGAASRQGEVDELQKKLHEKVAEINKLLDIVSSNNELQKRIDRALEKCYTGIRKQGGDYYLELVEEILKGQNNG